jgi:hypothetical protein
VTANELKAALRALGLDHDGFARIIGYSTSQIRRWLNGVRPIPTWLPDIVGSLIAEPALLKLALQQSVNVMQNVNSGAKRPVTTDQGEFPSIADAARAHNISRQAGHQRVKTGRWKG